MGLMTKIYQEQRMNFYFDENEKDQERPKFDSDIDFNQIPNEDVLTSKTLWPERNKLYGHHFEISVVRFD